MISGTVNADKVIRRFQSIPAAVRGAVYRVMQTIGFDLTGYVQQNKLQGQVLKHRSGWLSSHVHPETVASGNTISTVVGVDANAVPYARIHEYGGYIRVPEVAGPLMVFAAKDGTTVFTRRHKAFEVNMPERSYLRSSLAERRPHYVAMIDAAAGESVH